MNVFVKAFFFSNVILDDIGVCVLLTICPYFSWYGSHKTRSNRLLLLEPKHTQITSSTLMNQITITIITSIIDLNLVAFFCLYVLTKIITIHAHTHNFTHTHTHITSTRSLERSLWFPFSDLYGGNSTFGNANTAPIHLVELDRRNGKQTKNKNSQFLNSTQVSHRQMWITQKMSQQMAVNWWFMDLMKARGLPYFELARAWIG